MSSPVRVKTTAIGIAIGICVGISLLVAGCGSQRAVDDKRPPLPDFFIAEFNKRTSKLPEYSYTEEQRVMGKTLFKATIDADRLRSDGKFEQAEKSYKELLAVYESKLPDNDPQFCRMINRLMANSHDRKHWHDEEHWARRLVTIRDKWLGAWSPDSAWAAAHLADALLSQGKTDDAMRIMDERLAMAVNPADSADALAMRETLLLYEKAKIQSRTGHVKEALSNLARAEKLHAPLGVSLQKVEPTSADIADLQKALEKKI